MRRYLVSRLSSLGDVVCTLPVASALKSMDPEAHVVWAVDPRYTGVVECCAAVDEVLRLKPSFNPSTWPSFEEPFEAALDMQGLMKSAIVIARAKAKIKLGYHWQREVARVFSSPVLPDPSSLHVVDQYVDVVRALAVAGARGLGLGSWGEALGTRHQALGSRPHGSETDTSTPRYLDTDAGTQHPAPSTLPPSSNKQQATSNIFALHPCPDAVKSIRAKLQAQDADTHGQGGRATVILNPGAGWITKRWPPEHFAAVADWLHEQGYVPVLIGGDAKIDHEAAALVLARCKTNPTNLTGKTSMKELIALISLAEAHVGGDTGSTHIAAALGVPAVGLYSITKPARSCPYGQIENTLYDERGLSGIKPEQVIETLRRWLH